MPPVHYARGGAFYGKDMPLVFAQALPKIARLIHFTNPPMSDLWRQFHLFRCKCGKCRRCENRIRCIYCNHDVFYSCYILRSFVASYEYAPFRVSPFQAGI